MIGNERLKANLPFPAQFAEVSTILVSAMHEDLDRIQGSEN